MIKETWIMRNTKPGSKRLIMTSVAEPVISKTDSVEGQTSAVN